MSRLEPRNVDVASRRRRGWRGAHVVVSVLALVCVLVGGTFVFRDVMTSRGLAAIEERDLASAEVAFRRTLSLNWYERWRPPYNLGVVLYHQNRWVLAQEQFEDALDKAPEDKVCLVALNLAWSHEAEGDHYLRQKEYDQASTAWKTAEAVAKRANCADDEEGDDDSGKDGDGSESPAEGALAEGALAEEQERTESRNRGKAEEADQKAAQKTAQQAAGGGEESEPTQEQRLGDLEEQNQKAAQQRQNAGTGSGPGEGAGSQGGRPTW